MNDDAFFYREEHGDIEEPDPVSLISTADLVDELCSRDDTSCRIEVRHGQVYRLPFSWDVYGPARIIVVRGE